MATIIIPEPKEQKETLLKEIEGMTIPTPSIKVEFTMMQKLFAYWVKKKQFYGNWSGTGVGKTYSFILASRVIDAHLTVVIGVNSTTHQLAGEIKKLYNDSVIVVYDGKLPDFDMSKHNYLIFNYEKGQQEYSKKLFDSILDEYQVDYIVFDEAQLVKQTGVDCSIRRKNFQEFRDNAVGYYNSYVSVLTATPYTNSIYEPISILSLLTAEEYKNIHKKYKKTILANTIPVWNLLGGNGVCANTKPKNIHKEEIKLNQSPIYIDGDDDTFNDFKDSLKRGPLAIYQSTLQTKLEYLYKEDQIKKGELTIIYTQFLKGIADKAKHFFTDKGFRVCEYTGNDKDTEPYTGKDGIVDWEKVRKNYDIILASEPITTGVDGLQKVCNKMVILALPWTHAYYKQLIGRIHRNGSSFDNVEICIPMVRFPQSKNVGYDDKVWKSIEKKEVYSKACLHGQFPVEDSPKDIKKSIIQNLMEEMDYYEDNKAA